MNKNDIFLILTILIFATIGFIFVFSNQKDGSQVVVYYKNEIVLNVPITENNIYHVDGSLGDVVIEVNNNKVRVNEENSPRHLCSNQGWISNSYESIICLPNQIVINIENDENLDAIIK